MMLDHVIIALAPLGLMLAGCVLLWALSRVYGAGRESAASPVRLALTVAGWVLLLLGVFAAVAIMTHVVAFLTLPIAAVVLIAAARRYQSAERQSLLWVLTVAAERGIPLETAARAYGDERNDSVGLRAHNLADYLEAGVPLALALRRSGNPLPTAALLAADLGAQTGTLGPALRQVLGQMDELEATTRSILEKAFYLVCLVCFGLGLLTFLMLKIVPVFRRMFEEFDIELPAATQGLVGVTSLLTEGWFLFTPLLIVLLPVLAAGLLYYVGLPPRNVPVIGRLWRRADCASILRWLAIAVRQQWPMAETVRQLAVCFPQPAMRGRLERASRRIDRGAPWCESLRRAGLIGRAESVVFQSAERAGNLAWALDEMAEGSMRRLGYQLRAWVSVAFPAAVLVFGGCVFFIALGILAPLMYLIRGLA